MAEIIAIHLESDLNEFTATVTDSGDLAWSNDATAQAVAGTSGAMSCLIDDTTLIHGTKTITTNTSGIVRTRFYIDPNGLTIPTNNDFVICYLLSAASVAVVYLGYVTATGYRIRTALRDDASGYAYTSWINITDAPHYVEVLLGRATAVDASDGYLSMWVDGSAAGTQVTGQDNYDRFADFRSARIGAADALDASTSGTFYMDELIVNDDGSEIGPLITESASVSLSISPSISPSESPSVSPSASESLSISPSISPSESPSISPSASGSISISPSISPSESVSISPSISPSVSPSESPSASLSVSPSESPSISPSSSESPSISLSVSPSISLSVSPSPSIGPLITGSVCWGHVTGVIETNIETFADNWVGTGEISGVGDAEVICLDEAEWMESNVVNTGAATMELDQNHYDPSGETVTLKYRTGNTEANCLVAEWIDYTIPFNSLGYVQVRIEG